jgi:hypothetical protein
MCANVRSKLVFLAVAVTLTSAACAELVGSLTDQQPRHGATAADALREALTVGTDRAVDRLGRPDGYLGEHALRIDVPDDVEPVARALRVFGRDDLVAEFVTGMNRAAEAAAPLARDVFFRSIREMTFDDAMTILRGDGHEATDYLDRSARSRLVAAFRPVIDAKLNTVGATRSYRELMDEVSHVPFVDRPTMDLADYVTNRALDGLFLSLAREEEKIRRDPAARTTELLRTWFSRPA